MIVLYLYISNYHKTRKGMESIFANTIFQLNRNLQVYLQKSSRKKSTVSTEWRPSAICFSKDSFKRIMAFKVLNWISYKYGFGTYVHLVEGYFSKKTVSQAEEEQGRLIEQFDKLKSHVYVDTVISPSYTAAVSQSIQVLGIAGMDNNMVIFEFDKENPDNLDEILDNFALVKAGAFDVLLVGSSRKESLPGDDIHIWIKGTDSKNANLMIMLGFIILGHPDWKKSNIRIFEITMASKLEETQKRMHQLLETGRLPITQKNVEIIIEDESGSIKQMINKQSKDAGLTILGFRGEKIKEQGVDKFCGYEDLKTVLFVNSQEERNLG